MGFADLRMSGKFLKVVVCGCLWWFLACSLSSGDETNIACLKSIKASLQDPYNYLSSWKFNDKAEGFICAFTGIECWHPNENRVLNIELPGMGLKGEFPLGLKNCTSMTGLNLSSNEFYGSLPSNISSIIPYVTNLGLSSNNFSGEIPAALANCSYLNVLELDHNRFTGHIPLELGLLSRIKNFSVANNLLYGPVPQFQYAKITADSYANNTGLCGKPLEPCKSSSKNSIGV